MTLPTWLLATLLAKSWYTHSLRIVLDHLCMWYFHTVELCFQLLADPLLE